jgi:D-amino-acid dehydrogenase
MSKSVVIIGGGLQGLSSAFFLTERGADVTIIDSGPAGGGASRGNAGYMCTTILEPLANPSAIASAAKSLRDPTRALRIKPSAAPALAGWLLRFAKNCTATAHRRAATELVLFNRPMHALLDQMAAAGIDTQLSDGGLVVPFHDEALAKHWGATMAPMAELLGRTPAPLLDGDRLRAVIPALSDRINAGYVLDTERSIDPRRLVDTLISVLRGRGVRFVENAVITSFDTTAGRVSAVRLSSNVASGGLAAAAGGPGHLGRGDTGSGRLGSGGGASAAGTSGAGTSGDVVSGDEFLLTVGAGSHPLGKMLGLRLAVVPGQGYNVALPKSSGMESPVIFEEAHAAATPFADQIRLGGTMEFAGYQPTFDGRRVDAIIASMRPFVNLDWEARTGTWAGSRPMTADGKPYIGRPDAWKNVTVATGHGMFGLSLAPITGQAVTELILDGKSTSDLHPFRLRR